MKRAAKNAAAKELSSPKYRLRVVRAAKGKGSYRRNERRMSGKPGGASFLSGRSFTNLFLLRESTSPYYLLGVADRRMET